MGQGTGIHFNIKIKMRYLVAFIMVFAMLPFIALGLAIEHVVWGIKTGMDLHDDIVLWVDSGMKTKPAKDENKNH